MAKSRGNRNKANLRGKSEALTTGALTYEQWLAKHPDPARVKRDMADVLAKHAERRKREPLWTEQELEEHRQKRAAWRAEVERKAA